MPRISGIWLATALVATVVQAQFSQQAGPLIGTGATGNAEQGASVAVSADGNTAAIGGGADNSNVGAFWVWTRSGTAWTQQAGPLVGTGNTGASTQGFRLALSSDGNTAVIGGGGDNSNVGAFWVWTRSGSTWTQQAGPLVGSGGTGASEQGRAIALSIDGNTALVGGPYDDTTAGAFWVWTRSGATWTQQAGPLVGTGASGNAFQGYSVALSGDGNIALIGGLGDNSYAGAFWVWTRSGTTWAQQQGPLVGSGATGAAKQGGSVAVSADGNTALVSGSENNSLVGAFWVWTRSGSTWSQQQGPLVGTSAAAGDFDGFALALSANGDTAMVGGPGRSSYGGAVWVWVNLAWLASHAIPVLGGVGLSVLAGLLALAGYVFTARRSS